MALSKENQAISFRLGADGIYHMYRSSPKNGPCFQTVYEFGRNLTRHVVGEVVWNEALEIDPKSFIGFL